MHDTMSLTPRLTPHEDLHFVCSSPQSNMHEPSSRMRGRVIDDKDLDLSELMLLHPARGFLVLPKYLATATFFPQTPQLVITASVHLSIMASARSKRDFMDAVLRGDSTKEKSKSVESNDQVPRPGFGNLPPSIRNRIYAYALDTELLNRGQPNVAYTHSLHGGTLHFSASRSPFPGLCTALLYANKAIGNEARSFFHKKNLFIRLTIYTNDARNAKSMIKDSGLLFSVATPELIERSEQHAMDLSVTEKDSTHKRAVVMFPAQYLPRLINFLDQASRAAKNWATVRKIHIAVRNTYGFPIARLQGDLLELFRLLTNFGGVAIDGDALLPAYISGLKDDMKTPGFTATGFLENVLALVDGAEKAHNEGSFRNAADLAQSCIIALTYAFLTRAEALHAEPEAFTRNIQRLRWRCELVVAKALFALHQSDANKGGKWLSAPHSSQSAEKLAEIARNILAAETAASQALSIVTDSTNPTSNPWFQSLPVELTPTNKSAWFGDGERGMTWYVCGLIHAALGEHLFAAGDLERACGLCPTGEGFAEAFEKARGSIDWNVKPGSGIKTAARLAKGGAQ